MLARERCMRSKSLETRTVARSGFQASPTATFKEPVAHRVLVTSCGFILPALSVLSGKLKTQGMFSLWIMSSELRPNILRNRGAFITTGKCVQIGS